MLADDRRKEWEKDHYNKGKSSERGTRNQKVQGKGFKLVLRTGLGSEEIYILGKLSRTATKPGQLAETTSTHASCYGVTQHCTKASTRKDEAT